jgi:hypothetical protein
MGLAAQAFWSFTLYPEAGEGGGCFVPLSRAPRVGGGAPDVVRSQQEAAQRARTKVRRCCAANRLNRLATLTYAGAGCFDHARRLMGSGGHASNRALRAGWIWLWLCRSCRRAKCARSSGSGASGHHSRRSQTSLRESGTETTPRPRRSRRDVGPVAAAGAADDGHRPRTPLGAVCIGGLRFRYSTPGNHSDVRTSSEGRGCVE